MGTDILDNIFKQDELTTLLKSWSGKDPKDFKLFIEWCASVRLENSMLDLLITDKATAMVRNGRVTISKKEENN